MKNYAQTQSSIINILLLMGLAFSCSHKTPTLKTEIRIATKGLLSAMAGGMVIYGRSRESGERFTGIPQNLVTLS